MNKTALMNAILTGVILTSIFVLLVTIIGEVYKVGDVKPLKDLLKGLHQHHWIGKGIWAAILFGITIAATYPLYKKSSEKMAQVLPVFTAHTLSIVSLLLIVFFLYEYAIHH